MYIHQLNEKKPFWIILELSYYLSFFKDILLSKYLDTYMKSLSLKKINFGHQVPKSFAPNYLERSYFVLN